MSEAGLDSPRRERRLRLPVGLVLMLPALIFLAAFMVYRGCPIPINLYCAFESLSNIHFHKPQE
jgi:ABC-type sugar transport system permease subunit